MSARPKGAHFLRDHLVVGCDSLKVVTLVRIQVPQQIYIPFGIFGTEGRASRAMWKFGEEGKGFFRSGKKRASAQMGVRADFQEKISFCFKIFSGSDNFGLVSVFYERTAKFEPAIAVSFKILQFLLKINFRVEENDPPPKFQTRILRDYPLELVSYEERTSCRS